ncbi:adenylate kinase, partial [Dysosmobacter welbionis]
SQLNTASAGIIAHCCFFSVRTEETPQIVALNHILIATDFSAKLRVFNLQIGCAEFAADGFVLGKLLLQTGDLRLELCNQPVCSVKSLLQFGFLFLGCNVLLCRYCQRFVFRTLQYHLGGQWNGLGLNLFDSRHIDLLIPNFLNLSAERRRLLFLLAVLLREFCQPRLLLLYLELRHGQVFLRAAAFAALHIVVPGVAHIPEEIVLQDAVGF